MAALRRPGLHAGALLLLLGTAACSGMTHQAVGNLVYTTTDGKPQQIESPSVDGCHPLTAPGAKSVDNNTVNDVILYTREDCHNLTGTSEFYLSSQTSDPGVPGQAPWKSFTVVGGSH
ncbi:MULTISPECIES: hypothetical protein [unclassified Streptomyces]|uniref:hypothetical protein n=1 Tax=unclassified Streptomyces TaxID=2593676 RepID=UPI00382B4028